MPITRSLPLCRRTFVTDLAFNLIMDCGQAMLANGGEVFRAQDTMELSLIHISEPTRPY